MTFEVCCCADINGRKRNVNLAFQNKPVEIAYMAEQIEMVFRKVCFDKSSNPMSFAIDYIVFFEESSKTWKPLESPFQLPERGQLYVFQTNVAKEPLLAVPSPEKTYHVPDLPDIKARNVHNPGFSIVDPDKVEAVFTELDINNKDSISIDDMQYAFLIAGIEFKEDAVDKMFNKSDANSDGEITFDEFRIFADLFPNTTEVLYWRLCSGDEQPWQATAKQLKSLRQQEHDLRKELAQIEEASKILENRVRQERNIYRETDPRRRFMEAEEQDLMNKEYALQFHRDMVVQAENLFSETAVRFDSTAMNHGSPRRARMIPN